MENEKKRNTLIMVGSLLILLCVLIVIFLLIITNGNETRTSAEVEEEKLKALICRSGGREDGFFHSKNANQITNEIKATFNGDSFEKLYYSYEGVYRSTEVAEEETMHTEYNLYMGDNNMPLETLSPTYSAANNRFHLTLYTDDKSDFNLVTAAFFYVDKEDVEKFKKFSLDEMKKYYETKDFSCSVVK